MAGEKVGSIYYEVDADTAPLLTASKKVDDALGKMEGAFNKTDAAANKANSSMGNAAKGAEKFGSAAKDAGDQAGFIGSKIQKAIPHVSTIGTKLGETSAIALAMARNTKAVGDAAGQASPKLKETAEAAKKVATETSNASSYMGQLTTVVGAYLSLQTLKAVADLADTYGQYASRIKNATTSTEEYNMVQERLLLTANGTYRALTEAQEVYLATSDVLKTLGYNTEQVLDISDSLSYAFVRDAARADQATSAMDAYSKALQKGKIDADAWASIMTATPSLVEGIAAATGKTTAEIRKIGVEGKLSLEALNEGLLQSLDENKRVAEGMTTSTKDATVMMNNALLVFVGKVNEASGASNIFVEAVKDLSAVLQDPATIQAASDMAAGIVKAMSRIIQGAQQTVNVVRWMAEEVAAAIGGAHAGDVVRLEKELENFQKARGRNVVARFFDGYSDKELDAEISKRKRQIADYYKYARAEQEKPPAAPAIPAPAAAPRPKVNAIAAGGGGGGRKSGGARKQGKSEAERELERQAEATARYIQGLQEQANAIKNATAQEKVMADVMSGKVKLQDEQLSQALKLAEAIDQRSNAEVIADLTEQLTNASLSAKELAEKQALLRLNKWATPEQIEQMKLLVAQIGTAEEKARKLAEIGPDMMKWVDGEPREQGPDKVSQWEEEFNRLSEMEFREQKYHEDKHARLLTALELEGVTIQEYHEKFEQYEQAHAERMGEIDAARASLARQQYGAMFETIAGIFKDAKGEQSSAYKAMFAVSKAFAIADATVNAYNAISKAWASAPFPANLAAVAATAPQVMSVVSAISSANMGGGRMYGGNVDASKMYRVNEGGAPEIFNAANGQQFLMPNTRGEVVSNSDATGNAGRANVVVNVIESQEKAGQVEQTAGQQGEDIINVWISDFMGDGRTAGAIRSRFSLNPTGT